MTKLTQEDREKIVAFRREHPMTSMSDIAARFGIDRSYVSYLCRKAGLGRSRARVVPKRPAPKPPAPKPEIRANALPWATREHLMAGNGRVARVRT